MKAILEKQLQKVQRHYGMLREYKDYIVDIGFDYSAKSFEALTTPQKATTDAYLKRFSALQDYLGAKVFSSLLDVSGITYTKMSEVLTIMEKEEIIDLDKWIELRNIRNNLEHDYPDELDEALLDLKFCIESFDYLSEVIKKVFEFAGEYGAHP